MNRKKAILYFIIIPVVLILVIVGIRMMAAASSLRNQIPATPELSAANNYLAEQITSSGIKARKHPNAVNLGTLGMVYNSNGYYINAASCYKLAIRRNPKEWLWSYYLGCLNIELGNSRDAITSMRRVLSSDPGNIMAKYYCARSLTDIGSIDSAMILYREIDAEEISSFVIKNTSRILYFPLQVYSRYEIAKIYYDQKRYPEAERLLNTISGNQKNFGPAFRQLGILYRSVGDTSLSDYCITRANDLIPYTPPVDTLIDKLALLSRSEPSLMKHIDVAIRSANSQWAVDLINHGMPYFSDNIDFISQAIKQYLKVNLHNLALIHLQDHLNYYRNNLSELYDVAFLLTERGLKKEALNYLIAASTLKESDPRVLTEVAILLNRNGSNEYASSLMNEVIKQNSSDIKCLADAVSFSLELDDRKMAESYLGMMRTSHPGSPELKYLEGLLSEFDCNTEKAVALYRQSFSLKKQNIFLVKRLGNIYLQQKNWNEAIYILREALADFPNDSDLQEKLGSILVACPDVSIRNIQEGKDLSERAFYNYNYLIQTRISAGRSLSIACSQLGDLAGAHKYILKTIEIARTANISKDYMANLESLAKSFSANPK